MDDVNDAKENETINLQDRRTEDGIYDNAWHWLSSTK